MYFFSVWSFAVRNTSIIIVIVYCNFRYQYEDTNAVLNVNGIFKKIIETNDPLAICKNKMFLVSI